MGTSEGPDAGAEQEQAVREESSAWGKEAVVRDGDRDPGVTLQGKQKWQLSGRGSVDTITVQ
jgi:hypothetical protein